MKTWWGPGTGSVYCCICIVGLVRVVDILDVIPLAGLLRESVRCECHEF